MPIAVHPAVICFFPWWQVTTSSAGLHINEAAAPPPLSSASPPPLAAASSSQQAAAAGGPVGGATAVSAVSPVVAGVTVPFGCIASLLITGAAEDGTDAVLAFIHEDPLGRRSVQ